MEDIRVEAARQRVASGFCDEAMAGLLKAYDERLAVNIGLLNENAALKRRLEVAPEHRDDALTQERA